MVTSQEKVGIAIKYICVVRGARNKLIKNKDQSIQHKNVMEVNYV